MFAKFTVIAGAVVRECDGRRWIRNYGDPQHFYILV